MNGGSDFMYKGLVESLVEKGGGSILLAVLDGLGDVAEPGCKTPLEAASTPNLDRLAGEGALGQHIPISVGVTPGSGPAHLALFGYDPVEFFVGRGILSALGIGFPIEPGDMAARANFCTLDASGAVSDRRAGRIPTETCAALSALLDGMEIEDTKVFVKPEKEHRACVVFRGPGLSDRIGETDPGVVGRPPLQAVPLEPEAEKAARIVTEFLRRSREALADHSPANGILLRGYAGYRPYPSMESRFAVRAAAAALYPMYRGVASLTGMQVLPCTTRDGQVAAAASALRDGFDFVFLHHKPTDSAGEDGDFEAKRAAVESFDAMLPGLVEAGFDVICVTGDHSTPCSMKLHSWHPVPLLVRGGPQRCGWSSTFCEREAARGALGTLRAVELMPLLLASAGRLAKYGA